jgi:uncharacterized protein
MSETTQTQDGFAGSAVIRELFAAFYAGELHRMEEFVDPEVTVWQSEGLPYSGRYRGIEGFLDMAQKIYSRVEVDNRFSKMLDDGEQTVVFMDLKFTDRETGRTAESPNIEWYTFRDGRVIDIDVYYKDPQSIAALRD